MNILKKANEIVNCRSEEKERQYGPFAECNERAAKIASLISGKEFTTTDIYHFQIALKLAREAYSHKQDNLLDAVAYIGALDNYYQGIEPGVNQIPDDRPLYTLSPEGKIVKVRMVISAAVIAGRMCLYDPVTGKDIYAYPDEIFTSEEDAKEFFKL